MWHGQTRTSSECLPCYYILNITHPAHYRAIAYFHVLCWLLHIILTVAHSGHYLPLHADCYGPHALQHHHILTVTLRGWLYSFTLTVTLCWLLYRHMLAVAAPLLHTYKYHHILTYICAAALSLNLSRLTQMNERLVHVRNLNSYTT